MKEQYHKIMSFFRDMTIILCLFGITFIASHNYFGIETGPAVEIESMLALRNTISVGEPLVLQLRGSYLRLCNMEWHPQLQDIETGKVVWRDSRPGGGRTIGPFAPITYNVWFPDTVKPGHYLYRTTGFADCDGNQKATPTSSPDVEIIILSKTN